MPQTHGRNKFSRCVAVALLLVLGVLGTAAAAEYRIGGLAVSHAWGRPVLGDAGLASIYVTIVNRGASEDHLIGAQSPVALTAELRETVAEGDRNRARLVGRLTVAPGQTTELQPGKIRITLIGLRAPLAKGDRVPVTLEFERAGKLPIMVEIAEQGSVTPPLRR